MGSDFGAIFWKKTMGYSTGHFSKVDSFFETAITKKTKSESAQTFYIA